MNLLLAIAILAMAFGAVVQLVQAGEDALGLAVTLTGGFVALLGASANSVRKSAASFATTTLPAAWVAAAVVVLQCLVLFGLWYGRPLLFEALAEPKIEKALIETDFVVAQQALTDAQKLDQTVVLLLSPEIERALAEVSITGSSERAVHLTKLLQYFGSQQDTIRLGDKLLASACTEAAAGGDALDAYATVLARLVYMDAAFATPTAGFGERVSDFVDDLNNGALALFDGAAGAAAAPATAPCPAVYVGGPIDQPLRLLNAVRTFDRALPARAGNRRDPARQSAARTNLALYVERTGESADSLQRAADLYREALALDPANDDARLGLGLLWLRQAGHFDDPAAALDSAVDTLHVGWANPGAVPCIDQQENAAGALACFQLLTVEAGARLERVRGASPAADDDAALDSLFSYLDELAATHAYFDGLPAAYYFVSEAYYYKVQWQEHKGETPALEDLCRIDRTAEDAADFAQISRNQYADAGRARYHPDAPCFDFQ